MHAGLLTTAICLCLLACRSDGATGTGDQSTDQRPPTYDPEPIRRASPEPPIKPMQAKSYLNRPIITGGCLNTCDEPRRALNGFLIAIESGDAKKVRPYVNTAALVHSGERLGETWEQLFIQQNLRARDESIEKWLKRWLRWVDRISDPADRDRVEAGVIVIEENQKRLVVRLRPPNLEPDPDGGDVPVWRIVFTRRGLEWLVSEIDDRPKG